MQIKVDDAAYETCPGGRTHAVDASVEQLEKLLGGRMHFYKEDGENYPDDNYKTDFSVAGFADGKPFSMWNYKNGHYDSGKPLNRAKVVCFSIGGSQEFSDWLLEQTQT